ncbi:hypothetical protein EMIT07CA2_20601 [Brevibacillus sp. IT-7CA2]
MEEHAANEMAINKVSPTDVSLFATFI